MFFNGFHEAQLIIMGVRTPNSTDFYQKLIETMAALFWWSWSFLQKLEKLPNGNSREQLFNALRGRAPAAFFFVRWFAIRFFVSPRHELSRQKSYFRFLPCAGKKLNSANNSFLLQVRLQLYFFLSMNFHCFSSQSPQDFRRVNRGWRFLKWNCFLKPVTWWNWIDLLNNLLNFFFVSFVYPQCTWKRPWTQTIRVSSKCWNAKQPFWPNGSPPVNRASSWPPASSVASHLEKK